MEHVEADAEVHSNILRLTMASHKVDKVRLKLFVRDSRLRSYLKYVIRS